MVGKLNQKVKRLQLSLETQAHIQSELEQELSDKNKQLETKGELFKGEPMADRQRGNTYSASLSWPAFVAMDGRCENASESLDKISSRVQAPFSLCT